MRRRFLRALPLAALLTMHFFVADSPSLASPPIALPIVKEKCLAAPIERAFAQLSDDGRLSGLPADHVGPMQLLAPRTLRFDKVAVAIKSLQERGARIGIVVLDGSGKRVGVTVSLESELACVPLDAKKKCATPPRPAALFGIVGVVGAGAKKADAAEKPAPKSLLIEVEVLASGARIRASGESPPISVPLDGLDAALRGLIKRRGGAVSFYINAAPEITWQDFVTAAAVMRCVLDDAPAQGFDAVLLGTPSG